MSLDFQKFGIDLSNGALHIVDLDDPSCRVAVDQVVFDAVRTEGTWAVGQIVSVHGLPQGVYEAVPARMLRSLGIGPQFRPGRGVRGSRRFRATAGDTNFKRVTNA